MGCQNGAMAISGSYWEGVRAQGLAVPSDRPLDELTAELTRMLGDPDPETREGIAMRTLCAWVERGVYDDLLAGFGDGMAAGLAIGLGERGTESVFRRSASAAVLTHCIARDNERPLVPGGKVLEWGDRIAMFLLAERDLRGVVPDHGRAGAVEQGAEALAVLARSPHVSKPELTVLLDVIADRVLDEQTAALTNAETDRLARATVAVLTRNAVPLTVLEPWVARIASGASTLDSRASADAFLRSLYLLLALGPQHPQVRADLVLVLVDALRQRHGFLHP